MEQARAKRPRTTRECPRRSKNPRGGLRLIMPRLRPFKFETASIRVLPGLIDSVESNPVYEELQHRFPIGWVLEPQRVR